MVVRCFVATLIAALALCGTARAGSYQVTACGAGGANPNNSWTAFVADPAFEQSSTNCGIPSVSGISPSTSGLAVADVLNAPGLVPVGGSAGWMFRAPVGTLISGVSLSRDLYKNSDNDWHLFIDQGPGAEFPGQDCTIGTTQFQCETGPSTFTAANLAASTIRIGFICQNSPCVNGADDHDVRADLDAATVTLSANSPPSSISGSGPATQGYQRGSVQLNVSASDPVGIARLSIFGPGGLLATQSLSCDYTYAVPCPQASGVPIMVNVNGLLDGSDALTITATDAAGNQASGTVGIAVDHTVPSAPSIGGLPGRWTRRTAFTATAGLPSRAVPITAVQWQLCGATCSPATTVPVASHAGTASFPVSVPADGAYTLRALVVDAGGLASAAATAPLLVDRVAPRAPQRLRATPHRDGTVSAKWRDPSGELAPITVAHYQLCRHGHACPRARSTRDTRRLRGIHAPGPGRYTLRVWLQDAAGNDDPRHAASVGLTVP
jgi:hypothetical protein